MIRQERFPIVPETADASSFARAVVALLSFQLLMPQPSFAAPGDLDSTFGVGGFATAYLATDSPGRALVMQPDGKTVVVGRTGIGTSSWGFARFDANGVLDASFGSGGTTIVDVDPGEPNEIPSSVALQGDGKIVATGNVSGGPAGKGAVVRLTTSGALDGTFGSGGVVTGPVVIAGEAFNDIMIQPADQKIVVVGRASSNSFLVSRFLPNGALDPTFDGDGSAITTVGGEGYGGVLQSDGKIIVVGATPYADPRVTVVRYNSNGTLDTTFGGTGIVTSDCSGTQQYGQAVAVQPGDGKIVVLTHRPSVYGWGVVRYDANGNLDATFGPAATGCVPLDGGQTAGDIVIQPNGKILIAGGGTNTLRVARLNTDGTFDASFGGGDGLLGTGGFEAGGIALLELPDGRIIAGAHHSDGVHTAFGIARYIGGTCGDGELTFGEGCDDGNVASSDGCSAVCDIESGWSCGGEPSVCTAICGDGLIRGSEGCDDSNTSNGDCCSEVCSVDIGCSCAGEPSVCALDAVCGNGSVEGSEQCDDDNAVDGDGCSSACRWEGTCSSGGALCDDDGDCGPGTCVACGNSRQDAGEECDDGNRTSDDGCDSSCHEEKPPSCGPVPQMGCRTPNASAKSSVLMKDRIPDKGDLLQWKWSSEFVTVKADLGAPLMTTNFTLCVYDYVSTVPYLKLRASIPGGGTCHGRPCWKENSRGFKYANKDASPNGITKLGLKAGLASSSAAFQIQGRGLPLEMPTLPLVQAPKVLLQLKNSANSICWEASFSPTATRNDQAQFQDKSD